MVEGAESITPEQVKANVAKGKTYKVVFDMNTYNGVVIQRAATWRGV